MDDVRRDFEVRPLTADRWDDLTALFGERGASSGCWCMWWRVASKEWERDAGTPNRDALAAIVADGPPPGLIAYHEERPVGWVAVGPRDDYPRLNRSPKLKPVDDEPVWAVTCFYIDRMFRGTGVAGTLLRAAVDFAAASGATALEGFPLDPGDGQVASSSAFTGLLDMFRAAGFDEIARRGGRPVMRRVLQDGVLAR